MKLFVSENGSDYRIAEADEVMEAARGVMARRFRRGADVLSNPSKARDYLKSRLSMLEREVFGVLLLDTQHRLICGVDLFYGTVDAAVVHPREVVKTTLRHNTSYVICYHNHPSGDCLPSAEDLSITRLLKEALAVIEVRLIDHLIIGDGVYSFAEHGVM